MIINRIIQSELKQQYIILTPQQQPNLENYYMKTGKNSSHKKPHHKKSSTPPFLSKYYQQYAINYCKDEKPWPDIDLLDGEVGRMMESKKQYEMGEGSQRKKWSKCVQVGGQAKVMVEGDNKQVNIEIVSMEVQCEKCKNTREQYMEQLANFEQENEKLKRKCQQLKYQLVGANNKLIEDIAFCKQQASKAIEQKEKNIRALEKSINIMKEQNQNLRKDIEQMKEESRNKAHRLQYEADRIKQLQNKLKIVEDEENKEIKELVSQINRLRERFVEVSAESRDSDLAKQESEVLLMELQELEDVNKDLYERIEQYVKVIQKYEKQLQKYEKKEKDETNENKASNQYTSQLKLQQNKTFQEMGTQTQLLCQQKIKEENIQGTSDKIEQPESGNKKIDMKKHELNKQLHLYNSQQIIDPSADPQKNGHINLDKLIKLKAVEEVESIIDNISHSNHKQLEKNSKSIHDANFNIKEKEQKSYRLQREFKVRPTVSMEILSTQNEAVTSPNNRTQNYPNLHINKAPDEPTLNNGSKGQVNYANKIFYSYDDIIPNTHKPISQLCHSNIMDYNSKLKTNNEYGLSSRFEELKLKKVDSEIIFMNNHVHNFNDVGQEQEIPVLQNTQLIHRPLPQVIQVPENRVRYASSPQIPSYPRYSNRQEELNRPQLLNSPIQSDSQNKNEGCFKKYTNQNKDKIVHLSDNPKNELSEVKEYKVYQSISEEDHSNSKQAVDESSNTYQQVNKLKTYIKDLQTTIQNLEHKIETINKNKHKRKEPKIGQQKTNIHACRLVESQIYQTEKNIGEYRNGDIIISQNSHENISDNANTHRNKRSLTHTDNDKSHAEIEQLQSSVEEQAMTLKTILSTNQKLLGKMDALEQLLNESKKKEIEYENVVRDKNKKIEEMGEEKQEIMKKLEELSNNLQQSSGRIKGLNQVNQILQRKYEQVHEQLQTRITNELSNVKIVHEAQINTQSNFSSQKQSQTQFQSEPIQIIKQVIKQVPYEVVKEIVKQIPVQLQKQVVKQIPIPYPLPLQKCIYITQQIPQLNHIIQQILIQTIKQVPVYIEKQIQIPLEIIKQVEVQRPVYITKQVEVPVEVVKQVQVQKPIYITQEISVPVEILKQIQIPVYIYITKQVEVPVEVIKQVPVQVIKEVTQQIIKEVPIQTVKQIIRQVPVEVVKEVMKQVQLEVPQLIIIQNPIQIIKQVPIEIIKEITKEIPIEVIKQIPKEVPVEVIKQIIKQVPFEIIKEVPMEVVKQIPVEVVKQVIKEVPVQTIKQIIKEVPVQVEKQVIRQVPVEVIKQIVKQIPVQTIREVVKQVPVQVIQYVQKQVIKQVPLELVKEVEKQVIKEVTRQVMLELAKKMKGQIQIRPQHPSHVEGDSHHAQKQTVKQFIKDVLGHVANAVRNNPIIKSLEHTFVGNERQSGSSVKEIQSEKNLPQNTNHQLNSEEQSDIPVEVCPIQGQPIQVFENENNLLAHNDEQTQAYFNQQQAIDNAYKNNESLKRSGDFKSQVSSPQQRFKLVRSNTQFAIIPKLDIPSEIIKLGENNTPMSDRSGSNYIHTSDHYYMNSPRLKFNEQVPIDNIIEKYEQKLNTLTGENQYLRNQIEAMTNTIETLQREIGESKALIAQLQLSNKQLSEHLHESNTKIQENFEEIEMKNKEKSEKLQQKLHQYEQQVEQSKQKQEKFEKKLHLLESQRKSIVEEVESKEKFICNLQRMLTQKYDHITELQSEMGMLKDIIQQLQQKQKVLKQENTIHLDQIEDLRQKIKELEYMLTDDEEIHRKINQASRMQQLLEVLEVNHRKEIETMQKRNNEVINGYKFQVDRLREDLANMKDIHREGESKSIELEKLKRENTSLKSMVVDLNNQIIHYSKKYSPVEEQKGGKPAQLIKEQIKKELGEKLEENSGFMTPPRSSKKFQQMQLEDIVEKGITDFQNIQKITKVVTECNKQIKKRDIEIERLNKLIQNLENVTKQLETQIQKKSKGKKNKGESKSIINLINQLTTAQWDLVKSKQEKEGYLQQIKELEERLKTSEAKDEKQKIQEDQLLLQLMNALQHQKEINERLRIQIAKYKSQTSSPQKKSVHSNKKDSFVEFPEQAFEEISLEKLDNEILVKQVNLYKDKWEKSASMCNQLESQIRRLQQNMMAHTNCTRKERVNELEKKIESSEKEIIPKIQQQLKQQNNINNSSKTIESQVQKDVGNAEKIQNKVQLPQQENKKEEDNIDESEISIQDIINLATKKSQIFDSETEKVNQKLQSPKKKESIKLEQNFKHEEIKPLQNSKPDSSQKIQQNPPPSSHPQSQNVNRVQQYPSNPSLSVDFTKVPIKAVEQDSIDIPLDQLLRKKLKMNTKFTIAKKLVQFIKEKFDSKARMKIKTLCPQRIMIKNFNENNLDGIEIDNASMRGKSYETMKFYQAPQILKGAHENEMSLAWSIGIVIDQLFVGSLFYQKTQDIIDPQENYYYRGDKETKQIGHVLQKMLTKNIKQRLTIDGAWLRLSMFIS